MTATQTLTTPAHRPAMPVAPANDNQANFASYVRHALRLMDTMTSSATC